MRKLVLGVTGPGSSRLLDGQVKFFIDRGYQVFLLSPDHPKEHRFCAQEGCIHLPVKIEKEIRLISDLKSLITIIRHLRKVKPDIVNVGTPKMGLLATLAAYLLRIPNRIYTCRGLRYETEQGMKRWILKQMERLTVILAKQVIYVGFSLKDSAERNGTAVNHKSIVIGKGSSNGVNLAYFSNRNVDKQKREKLLQEFGLSNTFVVGYIGRVSAHKGSYELFDAFEQVYRENPLFRLVMVGHMDCSQELKDRIKTHPGAVYFEFQDDVPLFFSLFDVFVLPSWREGFSNVLIQAAAMGLPVITTNATGCRDAIANGYNGILVPVRSKAALASAMWTYFQAADLLNEHRRNSLAWSANFDSKLVWLGLEDIYKSLLENN